MSMTDLIGYMAGFFLMSSFLPQVIKTVRTRDASGLSVAMLLISLLSGIFYEIYGYQLGLLPVLVMNGVFLLLVFAQLVMTLLFNRSNAECRAEWERSFPRRKTQGKPVRQR